MTQEKLANMMFVTTPAVSQWEKGRYCPSVELNTMPRSKMHLYVSGQSKHANLNELAKFLNGGKTLRFKTTDKGLFQFEIFFHKIFEAFICFENSIQLLV